MAAGRAAPEVSRIPSEPLGRISLGGRRARVGAESRSLERTCPHEAQRRTWPANDRSGRRCSGQQLVVDGRSLPKTSVRVGRVVGIRSSGEKRPSTASAAITIVTNISAVMRSANAARSTCGRRRTIGSTIRSANRKAITPREGDPARPKHGGERHVADRAHEAEHGDERPGDHVLDRLDCRRRVGDEQALKKSSPSRPMNPARRKPIVISFHSIPQSVRKF